MTLATPLRRCEACDGLLDPNEPGHITSPSGTGLTHAVCADRGDAPTTPIVELASEVKCCQTLQYNCGHYGYGPLTDLPETCPECGDTAV